MKKYPFGHAKSQKILAPIGSVVLTLNIVYRPDKSK